MFTYRELRSKSRIFYPAVLLDQFISFKTRKKTRIISLYLLGLAFLVVIIAPYADRGLWQYILPSGSSDFLIDNIYFLRGFFLVFSVMYIKGYLIEGFYLSHYFKRARVDYEVARLVYSADLDDITASFLNSKIGEFTMDKLGITDKEVRHFLKNDERDKISDGELRFYYNARKLPNDDDRVVNLTDYLKTIFDADRDFRDFMIRNNISEAEFFGAVEWVQNIAWQIRNKEMFWSRENLSRVPSIGRNWQVDNADFINRYTHLIYEDVIYKSLGKDWRIFRDEAERLEDLLLDQKLNNTLLICENLATGMQVISSYGKMIIEGFSLPKFENKKIFVMNTQVLLQHGKNPKDLKDEFMSLVNQASKNKDVIIAIPDFVDFIEKTMDAGLDTFEILKDILKSKKVPFIAVVTRDDFNSVVEPDFELVSHFDKFTLPDIDEHFIMRVLQNEAYIIENRDNKNIIYPVLERIAQKHLHEEDPIKESLIELHRIYE